MQGRGAGKAPVGVVDVPRGAGDYGNHGSVVTGLAAVLNASEDESVRQAALHRLALMGEDGACQVALATAGVELKAKTLLAGAAGDFAVAKARQVPAAREQAEAKLQKYWQKLDKRGTGICFEAVPVESSPFGRR